MRYLCILLALLPLASFSQKISQPAPPDPVYDSTLVWAANHFGEEEYQKAIDLLKAVPESDTSYASALDMLALTYLSVDSLEQAIEVCDRGLKLRSAFKRHFYEMKGAGLDALKRHDEAIAVFNEGYKAFPKYTRFWYQMGLSYKAAKKYNEAAWHFQQYLRTNPYHSGSHLQLAVIWYNSDQLVPTLLAYQMYLLLSDDSDKSLSVLKSYEDMATGQNEINMDSLWIRYPESVDNFDELETIIRSKAALTPGYKTNIKLPYTNLVKTMQVVGEKLQYNKADTGFCMQYYVPLYMDMIQKGQYPASIYYAFRLVNDDAVQKEIKKQDAATTKMADAANEFLNKYRQDQWIKMGLSNTQTWFGDNGNLTAEGKFDETKSARQGSYIFYHPNSMMKSKGSYTTDGKGTGKWEYYFEEGGLQMIKYFQNDMLSDSSVSYQPNGELSEVLYYKADKLNGDARGYYPNGTLRAIIKFKDDQKNGKSVRYHSNGQLNYETTYLNDEVNGKYTEYHENGQLAETANYKAGNYDGAYKSYYSNGNLKNTGNYVEGKAEGEWKYYDEYGRLTDQGSFKAGNQEGKWKEFHPNGAVRSEGNYAGGNMSGDFMYYEDDGKLWSVLTFGKNGKLNKFRYVDKTGKVLSEGKESGGKMNLKSYHSNGVPFKEGMYMAGELEGKHTEWNVYGKIAYTRTYKKSELDGVETEFYNTGIKESETTYKNGVRDGLYVAYYKNGVISKQGWYKNGQQRGEWREYNPDGLLTETNYFQDGSLQGLTRLYNIAGKPVTEVIYQEGEVDTYTGLDTTGKVLYSGVLKGGAGRITTLHLNKKTDAELNYKHGSFDGEIKRYYANGKLRYSHNYSKGEKNGPFTRYDWQGNMTESGFHRDGYRDSTFTLFENGKPLMKATYYIGDLNGDRVWYYADGSVETSASFVYGTLNGYMTYYAMNKEPRYRLLFKSGVVQSYSYLGPDSNWVAEIPFTNGSGAVKAKYKNGNPSAEFTYNCNWYEGEYTLYHPNGKVAHTTRYKDHEQEGPSKEFYPDGKPMKEENYFYDELNGECKYYSAGGILERVSNYKFGSLHGTTKLFDKTGKITKTINFYNDEPY